MKILLDMNLSPDWVKTFKKHGFDAIHWSDVGDPHAPDKIIMEWAHKKGHVVFTHDLDFGSLLAVTRALGPSVFQIRIQNIMPGAIADILMPIFLEYEDLLEKGALITVDGAKSRVRILPF